jgi:diaminohydroxyphosphoribosylaminopyrimidine deaminase/5-amino-6-(5-phosphoribosylamino)uracil reductase
LSGPSPEDIRWLDAAVRYASAYIGTTADNPTVAALVVDPVNQTLISRAVTAKGGRPHAESQALEAAGFEASGRTLYVTLEPCHHWGRTPPCVGAVIRSGVLRVVIGTGDPDPRTAGESIRRLESAGVEVILADHAPSRALHAGHVMRHGAGRPFVTLKLAISADGMIGRKGEGNVAITGEAAREWTHMQRARSEAILIGASTAQLDDPQLTVRLPGLENRSPLRVILAGAKGIDRQVNLVDRFSAHRLAIIAETDSPVEAPPSVEVLRVEGKKGRPDLALALATLAKKGIQNLLVEPGARLTAALLDADLVDRFAVLTSPLVIGKGGLPATSGAPLADRLATAGLVEVDHQQLGDDLVTIFERPASISE